MSSMRLHGPAVLSIVFLMAGAARAGDPATVLGFGAAHARAEQQLEATFDAHLDAAQIGSWMQILSARPHHVGSPYGRENAAFLADQLRSFGFTTSVEEFEVLFPTPRIRHLEMLAPTSFTASLAEPPFPGSLDGDPQREALPVYNVYSADGDVSGELVYVNYGIPADYEELARWGIDVTGKIVIARYGGSWRGIKPKVAAEKGAIGCIIYSDPRGDGYYVGDVYPGGGYRPAQGAQRGSVADMPLYPGDPLTPFVGASTGAQRLSRTAAPTLTRIPVLPISQQDAIPLLRALTGPVAPPSWRGALPFTYHLGPGPARVRLHVEFNWKMVTLRDVIGRLEGSELPDQWILRGNHHDAWVNGATDPVSGLAALLMEAKALGGLLKDGWRPRRTIIFAAWDAEEPGLLGSVEWVEQHAAELRDRAAVYINSDSNSRGFLTMGGSHTLQRFASEVAEGITDPETDVDVVRRANAHRALSGGKPPAKPFDGAAGFTLSALGSGSDYTPFLQHLGIASLNIGFSGEGKYGQYHSSYDTFDHYRRFMDPNFRYGVTLAQLGGHMVLRLANADTLPIEFSTLADTVSTYVEEVEALANTMRDETALENRRIAADVYRMAWDPEEHRQLPQAMDPVPHLEFAPLENALAALKNAADAYTAAARKRSPSEKAGRHLDRILIDSERALTRDQGLPGRPWFIHHLYAPGFYTGYGVKTLPGIREAIEQRQWEAANRQIRIAAQVLEAEAKDITAGERLLER